MRLERGVLTWREGPGALTQRRRCSGSSPLPHPPGCPLKPGGSFDLGSTGLSAGPARWTGGGAEEPTSPQALPSPGPLHPHLGMETVSGCFRGHPSPAPTPALQLFPSCPAPPQRQLGERLGAGSRAQLLGSGWDPGGQGHERARAGGGGGRRNPPAVASRRAPHIWATGTAAPRQWGGGRSFPDTQPFPERGVVTPLGESREGHAGDVRAGIS